jgi:hypothetical protein
MKAKLETKDWQEYEDFEICLVRLDNIPPNFRMDYATRNNNVEAGNKLCEHCDGTGNEFLYRYRKCPKCFGTGRGG